MRSRPKVRVKPLATTNNKAAKVSPLSSWNAFMYALRGRRMPHKRCTGGPVDAIEHRVDPLDLPERPVKPLRRARPTLPGLAKAACFGAQAVESRGKIAHTAAQPSMSQACR